MLRILLLLFCWQVSGRGQAQDVMRSDHFFENILDSQSLRHDYDQQKVNLPWIETYEFRTESDEFDFDRQEYLVRLTPTSPRVRKAQSALFDHYREKLSLVESYYVNDKIEEAYYQWTDLYINQQKLAIYQALRDISQDKQAVYQQQARGQDFDYTKLVDAQKELNDLNLQIRELALKASMLKARANLGTETLIFEDMIGVDQITQAISSMPPADSSDAKYDYRQALLDKEIALERAEKRKIFDFVQVRYAGPHDDLLGERIAVGAAIKIPTSGNRNLKIEEIRIEQQELALEQQIARQKIAKEMNERLLQIRSKVAVYQTFEEVRASEIESYQAISTFVAQEQGEDPLLLLEINENIEKVELDKVKHLEEIYEGYLEYLSLSGKMFARPFKNYLTK